MNQFLRVFSSYVSGVLLVSYERYRCCNNVVYDVIVAASTRLVRSVFWWRKLFCNRGREAKGWSRHCL